MPERSLSFSTSGFALSMSAISVFTPVFRLQGRRCIFEIARKLSTSEACVRLMCSSEEGQMRESWCVVQRSAGMCIKQADMRCEHVISTCEHVISACLDPLAPHSNNSFEKAGMPNLIGCGAILLHGVVWGVALAEREDRKETGPWMPASTSCFASSRFSAPFASNSSSI
jgi:hypothetical protein